MTQEQRDDFVHVCFVQVRVHQRREAAFVARADVGSVLEERLNQTFVAHRDGEVEKRHSTRVLLGKVVASHDGRNLVQVATRRDPLPHTHLDVSPAADDAVDVHDAGASSFGVHGPPSPPSSPRFPYVAGGKKTWHDFARGARWKADRTTRARPGRVGRCRGVDDRCAGISVPARRRVRRGGAVASDAHDGTLKKKSHDQRTSASRGPGDLTARSVNTVRIRSREKERGVFLRIHKLPPVGK